MPSAHVEDVYLHVYGAARAVVTDDECGGCGGGILRACHVEEAWAETLHHVEAQLGH